MNKPWLKDAKELHKNMMYGDKPFSYHLDKVSETAEALYGEDKYLSFIAAFHDSLEEKIITFAELYDLLKSYNLFDRTQRVHEILLPVVCLTKESTDSRKEYLTKVKENPLATRVKIADAMCNLRSA